MSNEIAKREVSLVDIRLDANTYPRLNSYDRQEAIQLIAKIVYKALMYRGQSIDAANVNFISTNLYDELMSERELGARYITIEEMKRVVNKSVLHDNIYGVSVASLYKVIIEYVKGEGHVASVQAIEKHRSMMRENEKRLLQTPANILVKLLKK